MVQHREPQPAGPNDPLRTDLGIVPGGSLAPAPPRMERTEQIVESAGGVEHQERVVTDQAGMAHQERTVHDVAGEQQQRLFRITQLVWLFFGGVETLIGMRVLLKLIGANPDNEFARLIYNLAGLFAGPFLSLVDSPASGGMVLEVPSLIAIIVYALLGWAIVGVLRSVIWPMVSRSTTSTTSTYDRYRS